MASTLKLTEIKHPSSDVAAITIGSDNSVSLVGGALSPQTGFKNRIINGAAVLNQYNAGDVPITAAGNFVCDRFYGFANASGKLNIQRALAGAYTPPAGFIASILCASQSAYSVGAAESFSLTQKIEGFNISDLAWGSAAASAVTLSFWARSTLTGTFGGSIRNGSANRSYPFAYTISAANAWEYKTITIPGDTTGTWAVDNSTGILLTFSLGAGTTLSGTAGVWAGANYSSSTGAVSVVGTSGATLAVTGVQLERGSAATPFEFRSYGQELSLAQRYYYRIFPNLVDVALTGYGAGATTTTSASMFGSFPVPMRIRPTALEQSGTAAHYAIRQPGLSNVACNAVPTYSSFTSESNFYVSGTVASGLTANLPALLSVANAAAYLGWSAEL
jgi:hypothetical protein